MSNVTPVINLESEGPALLQEVVDYYHATLMAAPEALDYLKSRGIDHPEAIAKFRLGYANRTLGLTLPEKNYKAGAQIRGRLAELGLYRESGHEHFNGSLVIPVMDEAGQVAEVYGRKIQPRLRKGTPLHLYLSDAPRGVWNLEALSESEDIILAKSLMDALSFWCAGFRHVTAAYGLDGFTQDHLDAFQRYGTKRVLIGFDSDPDGDRAAAEVADRLQSLGIECYRIQFPQDVDANDVVRRFPSPGTALGQLIQAAAPLGKACSRRFDLEHEEEVVLPEGLFPGFMDGLDLPSESDLEERIEALEALDEEEEDAASAPAAPQEDLSQEIKGTDLILRMEDRTYRVRGWQKPLNAQSSMKVNVMVSREDGGMHVDTLDLYQAKARTAFVRQAGLELGASEDRIKGDLGRVLRQVEELQSEELSKALMPQDARPELTEDQQIEAMGMLKDPDLVGRILRDFETLGIVGEESNKLTGYLAATSRLLDRPLALMVQSSSAAGKTSLMDAVLNLMPEEDVVRYSAMSGQSLFYMGDRNLKHKILSVEEEEGAKQASYALKLLQSEGKVTMASTGKDAATGKLTTHDYSVEGPVSLLMTTTAVDLDEELLNRCLVLTVNESREQTRAIHALQRSRETLEGLLAKSQRDGLIALYRNAQRLLESLVVVNPFGEHLGFHDHQTRSRRDHMKYLTLIRAVALLHQHQREVKTFSHQGDLIRYIEVIPQDIVLANRLAQEVLGRGVDELLPQTQKLLGLLHGWVREECHRAGVAQSEFRFSRKQVRDALGWGDTQLKTHLSRLADLEFLVVHRNKHTRVHAYELLFQGSDEQGRAHVLGLIDPSTLTLAGTKKPQGHRSEIGRGTVGGQSVGRRGQVNAAESNEINAIEGNVSLGLENTHQGVMNTSTSNMEVM